MSGRARLGAALGDVLAELAAVQVLAARLVLAVEGGPAPGAGASAPGGVA